LGGYVDRPDHGTNGAYPAWPPLSFEALTVLENSFGNSLQVLLATADSAYQGPYGQAQAVQVVGPPKGNVDVAAFKTTRGATRYTAIAGGSFADAFIRRLFGYQPGWSSLTHSTDTASNSAVGRGLSQAFWMQSLSRTANAELQFLRTGKTGHITTTASDMGLQVSS
jgi:hypothetical protein